MDELRVILVGVIIGDVIGISMDNINFSPKKKTVKVVEIEDYKNGGIINTPVLMDDKRA